MLLQSSFISRLFSLALNIISYFWHCVTISLFCISNVVFLFCFVPPSSWGVKINRYLKVCVPMLNPLRRFLRRQQDEKQQFAVGNECIDLTKIPPGWKLPEHPY